MNWKTVWNVMKALVRVVDALIAFWRTWKYAT
jgi:hypothetical protein